MVVTLTLTYCTYALGDNLNWKIRFKKERVTLEFLIRKQLLYEKCFQESYCGEREKNISLFGLFVFLYYFGCSAFTTLITIKIVLDTLCNYAPS